MKSTLAILGCSVCAMLLALGSTAYGFVSGNLSDARAEALSKNQSDSESFVDFDTLGDIVIDSVDKSHKIVAIDMGSIPDNLTTDEKSGTTPLILEGKSGKQYTVTDADGNTVYIKDSDSNKSEKSDIDKSDLYIKYIVKRGDTLSDLSNEFGSSVGTLVHLNNIDDPDLIYTNETLHIPSDPPVIVSEEGGIMEP